LPADGMQEVSGSSPLSSTGQKPNSKDSNSEYSRKVQQRRPGGPPYVCSDRMFPRLGCWQDTGSGAEPTLVSPSPGQIPPHRSGDFCRLASTPPSRRAIRASGCCRTCKWSGRAGCPGRCDSLPGAIHTGNVHGRGLCWRICAAIAVRTPILRRWQGQQPRSGGVRARSALVSGAWRVLRTCRRAPRGHPWIGPVR
jgi:hypothetical protein